MAATLDGLVTSAAAVALMGAGLVVIVAVAVPVAALGVIVDLLVPGRRDDRVVWLWDDD